MNRLLGLCVGVVTLLELIKNKWMKYKHDNEQRRLTRQNMKKNQTYFSKEHIVTSLNPFFHIGQFSVASLEQKGGFRTSD